MSAWDLHKSLSVRDTRIASSTGHGDLHVHAREQAEYSASNPVVVLSHGFITDGVENHRMFVRTAAALNRAGFSVVLFDYYGCGYSDGDYTEFRISRAVSDLTDVCDWAVRETSCSGRVALLGQSLGTAIIALTVARKELRAEIACTVLWNLSALIYERYLALFGEGMITEDVYCLEHKGYSVGRGFMQDAREYDVLACFDAWKAPTLFINAGADEVGRSEFSEVAASKARGAVSRVVIPGANHSFNCQPAHEAIAIDQSVAWIRSYGTAA
jgi:uncharacterized protein